MNINTNILQAAVVAAISISTLTATSVSGQFDLGVAENDVWAYIHAQDPGGDPVLRIWGVNGLDVNPTGYPGRPDTVSYFSYGFVTWDIGDVPREYEWNGATLSVTVAPDSVYDPALNDTYLRLLGGPFDESTWSYGEGPGPIGGAASRLVGDDSAYAGGGSVITFEIPRDIPRTVLRQWAQQGFISVAITSNTDPANDATILRLGSGENLLYEGPRLILH